MKSRDDFHGHSIWIVVAGGMLLCSAGASYGQFTDFTDEASVGDAIRAAMGYDQIVLGALDIPGIDHGTMAVAAIVYANDSFPTMEPLAMQWFTAKAAAGEPGALDDPGTTITAIQNAAAAIAGAAGVEVAEWYALCDENAQAAIPNVAANAGLDPLIALLPLTEVQRSQIWAATLERDAVVRNPYKWHRTSMTDAAHAAYWVSVYEILSLEQIDQLDAYEAMAEFNVLATAQIELDAIETAEQLAFVVPIGRAIMFAFARIEIPVPDIGAWFAGIIKAWSGHGARADKDRPNPKVNAVSMISPQSNSLPARTPSSN